jgi:hypothetical protein
MYKLTQLNNGIIRTSDNAWIPLDPANTDYQAFKSAVLEQQLGGLVEDGDSFSLNTNPDASILQDADGNVMTIDQAKEYVRTLP